MIFQVLSQLGDSFIMNLGLGLLQKVRNNIFKIIVPALRMLVRLDVYIVRLLPAFYCPANIFTVFI